MGKVGTDADDHDAMQFCADDIFSVDEATLACRGAVLGWPFPTLKSAAQLSDPRRTMTTKQAANSNLWQLRPKSRDARQPSRQRILDRRDQSVPIGLGQAYAAPLGAHDFPNARGAF